MLLQSYAGFIEIMPAVPAEWQEVSFDKLRAEGAFLISAKKTNGQLSEIALTAEKGGMATLKLPPDQWRVKSSKKVTLTPSQAGYMQLNCKPGGKVLLVRK